MLPVTGRYKIIALIVYLVIISSLAFLSLWRGLGFHFWRDDWGQLWAAVYRPELILKEFAAIRLHPGSAIEQFIGAKFFGLNPLAWQIFGLSLRILDSLALSLMIFGMTRSLLFAFLAGVFFAPFSGGLESYVWVSAHTSALLILFFGLGSYFWFRKNERKFNLWTALILLGITTSISPGRAIFLIILLPIWDLLCLLEGVKQKTLKVLLLHNLLLFLTTYGVMQFVNTSGTFSIAGLSEKLSNVFYNPGLLKNYFNSIGNLWVGWIIPLQESGSLSSYSKFNTTAGFFLFILFVLIFIYFIFSRKKFSKILLFFGLWINLIYIPNWLFDQTLVLGTSHRYLTLSSVGLIGAIAYLVSSIRQRQVLILVSLLFVFLNIVSANRILKEQSKYRSFDIVESLWNKIDSDVPKNAKNLIFMYTGGDYLRGVALDWSFSIPFGIKRGVLDVDDFPIVTGDRDLITKLICNENVSRPSVGKWSVQKERVPLSHIYAWKLQSGVMQNISEKVRAEIKENLSCKYVY